MFRRSRPLRRSVAVLAALAVGGALALVAPAAQAAVTVTWTGASGANALWSNGGNWQGGTPPALGDTVVFPAGGQPASQNDLATIALDSVVFNGAGYVVGGQPINVVGNGIVQSVTGTNAIAGIAVSAPITQVPVTIANGGILNVGPVFLASSGLTKLGTGKLVLQSGNSYTGATVIGAGALIVNGNSAGSTHNLTGGALGGSGVVGPVNASGGVVSPGDGAPGVLTVNGALAMTASSGYAWEILNTTAGTGFDVLRVSSTVNLGGAQLVVSGTGSGAINQQFIILDNQSATAIQGTFANLAEGAQFTAGNGQTYKISYVGGTGNDVVLTQLSAGGGKAVVLGGPDRIDTAILISKNSFPAAGSASAVVLARADLFPDALAGAPLAVAKGGPLELTSLSGPTFIDPRTVAEIQRVLSPGKTIFVLGGTAAIADSVLQQLQAAGYQVIRLGGVDRFQTAVIIAQNGLNNPTNLLLANGINFPDALSAGPSAAKVQGAILLTNNNLMPSFTQQYLASRTGATLFALGGPAAAAAPQATPLVGADRYQTAVMAAQRFFTNPTAVGIASGVAFPDGLTGGAHIGKLAGPLLLTDPNSLPGFTQTYLQSIKATLTQLFVYGGSTAIATPVVTQINTAVT
jgi:autotransporter-associated beta strand protein